jgi:hypothetical protein
MSPVTGDTSINPKKASAENLLEIADSAYYLRSHPPILGKQIVRGAVEDTHSLAA